MDSVVNALTVSLYEGLVFGLLSIGLFMTFRVLDFPDLTMEGSFPLGGAVAATLIARGGLNPLLATLVALFAGAAAGAVTGLLNTKLRITALLSGLIVMVGLYSVNLNIMSGANISLLRENTIFKMVGNALNISGIWLSIVVAAIAAAIFFFILRWFLQTEIGLALRASGNNEQMVRGMGADTNKNIVITTAIANALVATAGALIAQNQGFSDVGMGIGVVVVGLAAVIIGEALFRPRTITQILLAAFGGTFIYRLFITVALRVGMPPQDLRLVTAALVVLALAIPFARKKLAGEWLPPATRS
ncbi:MAG: ABC transporter permease [Actinomycetia bacterium]|nr:ABC transporter permease [Actinomycetes bacterium]